LEVLERACAMLTRLAELQIPARFASDLAVAKALAEAARTGALENVRINLDAIKDQDFRASVEARLRALNLDE
jgi:formiminotetrahydrofolate cyclodeaminase